MYAAAWLKNHLRFPNEQRTTMKQETMTDAGDGQRRELFFLFMDIDQLF